MAEGESKRESAEVETPEDPLVQYLVVRKDLGWPLGALMAQACHASIAAIWENRDDADTTDYMKKIDSMHKVVLEAGSAAELEKAQKRLKDKNVMHKLWTEQPENIPTCIATKPYPRSVLKPVLRGLRLLR